MPRDQAHDARRIAAAATLARIRRDRKRAPARLKKLFTYLARNLFQTTLDATSAWRGAGIRDHALTAAFKDVTGTSLKPYFDRARIDVAEVLFRTTDLDASEISLEVGYGYHPTFTDNYQRFKGSEQDRWAGVLDLAPQCLPILESLKLYRETVAAVSLLSQAVEAGEVPSVLLRHVRNTIRRDPLVGHTTGVRIRELPDPHR